MINLCLISEITWAKVRPAETMYPTDFNNLGKGYQPPSSRYTLSAFGGIGGTSEPYKSRGFVGLTGALSSPVGQNELSIEWALFNHSLTTDDLEGSNFNAGNLALDWKWIWTKKAAHPTLNNRTFIGVGLAVPMGQLKESDSLGLDNKEVLIQADGALVLSALYGGMRRWMWEPNSAAVFSEMGWHGGWGALALNLDLGAAFLYRVIDSEEIESQNIYVHAQVSAGYRSQAWSLLGGGGYGLALTSLDAERDQAQAHVKWSLHQKTLTYFTQIWAPLDPPLGLLGGESIWVAQVGIEGRL
jgi:hypothetical protein